VEVQVVVLLVDLGADQEIQEVLHSMVLVVEEVEELVIKEQEEREDLPEEEVMKMEEILVVEEV
jgi:hypothetical protein